MIVGLLALVLYQGLQTFWPAPLTELKIVDESGASKALLGEIASYDNYRPDLSFLDDLQKSSPELAAKAQTEMKTSDGQLRRELIQTGRTAALQFAGAQRVWINDFAIQSQSRPDWALVAERFDGGRSYGIPKAFLVDDNQTASTPDETWQKFQQFRPEIAARRQKIDALNTDQRAPIEQREQSARLALVGATSDLKQLQQQQPSSTAVIEQAKSLVAAKQLAYDKAKSDGDAAKQKIDSQIEQLKTENARYALELSLADGQSLALPLAEIVRAYPANRLSLADKLGVYFSRWWEFLTTDPRGEGNTEGGVFPAIWGTVAMTLIMSLMVVPFGVLAALYLREYAKAGAIVSAIRISINNLAGVPSIVFGVFGLGLFCYVIGASIDQIFFRAALADNNTPTFGTGGIMWASLTLALLTLPVVIVATEEALAAVPNSMREGSYACGASKWQTIRRIVLPRALPGIMTGAILAMARGAGEVAPLMLVGVMDKAPALPVDGVFPFVHPQRSFMHLAYQIYTVGFRSADAEAAKPMVFTATLLLIAIVAFLNIAAVYLRSRLRRKFALTQF